MVGFPTLFFEFGSSNLHIRVRRIVSALSEKTRTILSLVQPIGNAFKFQMMFPFNTVKITKYLLNVHNKCLLNGKRYWIIFSRIVVLKSENFVVNFSRKSKLADFFTVMKVSKVKMYKNFIFKQRTIEFLTEKLRKFPLWFEEKLTCAVGYGAAGSGRGETWPRRAGLAGPPRSAGPRPHNDRPGRRDQRTSSPPPPSSAGWSRGTHTPPHHQYHTAENIRKSTAVSYRLCGLYVGNRNAYNSRAFWPFCLLQLRVQNISAP